jgi:hypothetical protein
MSEKKVTTSQAAAQLGVPAWRVRRLADALLPGVPRAGLYRLLGPEEVAALKKALGSQPAKAG